MSSSVLAPPRRRLLTLETLVVVSLAIGLSAARSVLSFVGALLSPDRLSEQTAQLNGSLAPGQPLLDLGLQIVSIVGLLLPVAVVMVVAGYSGESMASFGVRTDRWRADLAVGVGAAAAVGGVGLAGYLLAHQLGYSLTVVPTSLPETWWRIPVLVLAAAANAVLEEVVVVGYLLRRLEQLGWAAGQGRRVQRHGPSLLPPLPGSRRVRRKPADGAGFRPLVPAHRARRRAHRGAHPHRRRRVLRLRAARRPRVVAAGLTPPV